MTLYLIYHGRIPGEKAASLFAMKSAEAFADMALKNGEKLEVKLIAPRRKTKSDEDAFDYYGVKRNFEIIKLDTIDLFGILPHKFAFYISLVTFSLTTWKFLLKSLKGQNHVVYSNETLPLYFASFITKRTFLEMHDFPEKKLGFYRNLFSKMKWILVHSVWKMEKFKKDFTTSAALIHEPNAVDMKDFDIDISKEEARRKLGLDVSKKYVMYTGHLFGWKGVDTLAAAAALLPTGTEVLFIGGAPTDVERFRKLNASQKNISVLGHKPHAEIPLWQKAADVLVLPNTAKEAISKYYTSPMKLFEYMASKRPIVASRIPSIEEIVSDKEAFLVEPDDAQKLAEGIAASLVDAGESDRKSQSAYARVTTHTWTARAQRIVNFIQEND